MTFKTILIPAILCFLVAACAPIQVKTDYDRSANFGKFKQYQWIPNEQPDLVEISIDKTVLDKTVYDTVTHELAGKGYTTVAENPDFLVTYYLVINAKTDVYFVNQYYTAIGLVPEPSRTTARDYQKIRNVTYEQGILIIDILDGTTNERIWRGYAQSRTGVYDDPEKQIKRVKTAVKKIFARFPP